MSELRIAIADYAMRVYCFPRNLLEIICWLSSVSHKKGYKLTKQGKGIVKMGWKQVISEAEGRKMSSDMTNTDTAATAEFDVSSVPPESLLFAREVG